MWRAESSEPSVWCKEFMLGFSFFHSFRIDSSFASGLLDYDKLWIWFDYATLILLQVNFYSLFGFDYATLTFSVSMLKFLQIENAPSESHLLSKRMADGSKRVRVPHILSQQVIITL